MFVTGAVNGTAQRHKLVQLHLHNHQIACHIKSLHAIVTIYDEWLDKSTS